MTRQEPRVVASVEARMGSSRLPGKVLADVGGVPAIQRLFARLGRCHLLDGVVLATSTSSLDDPLAAWARSADVPCFRGSEEDVLARVVGAQRSRGSDIVIEVTGDCPLLDPVVIDLGVETFLRNDCDVVTNVVEASFPQGIDVQVFPLALLEEVERTVQDPGVREHVSLHFYRNPERYRTIHLVAPEPWADPDLRCQLDYPEDLEFIRAVYAELGPVAGDGFGVAEVMQLLQRRPQLRTINAHCVEKPVA